MASKLLVLCLPLSASVRSRQRSQIPALSDLVSLDKELSLLADLQHVGEKFRNEFAVNGSRDRSDGYDLSADYIMRHIKSISPVLNPVQEFYDDTMWRNTKSPTLSVDGETFKFGTDFGIMTYSGKGVFQGVPSVPKDIHGCTAEDWADFPAGQPAVVSRGDCTFCQKVLNAKNAGASAFLLHVLEGTSLISPRLNCDWGTPDFPTFSATYEVGQMLKAGSVQGESFGENIQKKSSNVILDFPGGDPNFVVVLGAHLDSVPDTPGINDNGSGCALIMEILRNCVRKYMSGGLKNGLRFAWFGSEEWGLIGSRVYTRALSPEDNLKIAGMLNFDMMASSNGGYFINKGSMHAETSAASGHIQHLFEQGFESFGLPWEWSGLGGSDYASFHEQGIPAGGILAGASSLKSQAMADRFGGIAGAPYAPCYHKPCDTYLQFDKKRMYEMTRVTAHVTENLATDPMLRTHLTRAGPGALSLPATDEGVIAGVEAQDDEDEVELS